jgi:hypothetical protein
MVINLTPALEAAISEQSKRLGVAPEQLALDALQRRFLPFEPQDEWERNLLALARDCGVALSDEAVSSEGIYD